MFGSNRIGLAACILMMGWLSGVLWLDRASGSGDLWLQSGLGAGTWVVLVVALRRVSPVVRAQTAVVVAFATAVEYIFSPTLEVYVYRFDNVPMYVPPGHGLVYLSAFALGHTRFVERHMRALVALVLVAGGLWAWHGLFLAERQDALGAFWFACLAGFLLWGPSKAVYVGAFVVVSYLELLGTGLGNWVWQSDDPTGWVSIGNPPSGAAGGYGWFDLAGLLAAPYVLRMVSRGRLPDRDRTPAVHPPDSAHAPPPDPDPPVLPPPRAGAVDVR
ncbi:MAG: hypothetical protein ACRDPJ_20470 [Nocardioidaceae bacterium]